MTIDVATGIARLLKQEGVGWVFDLPCLRVNNALGRTTAAGADGSSFRSPILILSEARWAPRWCTRDPAPPSGPRGPPLLALRDLIYNHEGARELRGIDMELSQADPLLKFHRLAIARKNIPDVITPKLTQT
jgi:hypothetical protein